MNSDDYEDLARKIEEVKKKLALDRRITKNSPLSRRIEARDLSKKSRESLETRFRNRGNPEVIRRIIDSGIFGNE